MRRTLVLLIALNALALAARPWSEQELRDADRAFRPGWLPRPESLVRGPRRFNYLERIKLAAEFAARYQVADSGSGDFGGIIEAEHMPNVIETDNTQEAIWVWSRWYELTGRDDYRTNINRAWAYVLRHPAYWEHAGVPSSLWYAIWNSGLAFMAESRYRSVYGDSTYSGYADSCRGFYLKNPLGTAQLDNMVTAQSSGMAYAYGVEHADQLLLDSALARGNRVRAVIEAAPRAALGYQNWAMCGGTMFWGVAHTCCLADTVAGKTWLLTYADSLPGFYPTATWNCSHNIWLANAYRAAAELTRDDDWWLMHHYLTDTLLQKDTDRDGGIPATWTDPNSQDQTWVTTYLDFMGMDALAAPVFERDRSVLEFVTPSTGRLYQAGDTVAVEVPVANVGLVDESSFDVTVTGPGYARTVAAPALPFLGIDTMAFPGLVLPAPGLVTLDAVSSATPDYNRLNDTARLHLKVYGRYFLSGTLCDSTTGAPIAARVSCRIADSPATWDSTATDSLGGFRLAVADTDYVVAIRPVAPYFDRSWPISVRGDTAVTYRTQPAHLLLVNSDPAGSYDGYYGTTFDSLGISWCGWHRSAGPPPFAVVNRLRSRTIVWFSGDAVTGTVPAEDRNSLLALAGYGLNLLLTGQNIGQELAGTPLLESLCGCRFDSTGWSQFFVFGNRADSLGSFIGATSTAGGDGAGNQTSRDVLSPTGSGASLLAVYDTLSARGAAVRRQDPQTGTRTIVLGFGFEAVNRPQSRPGFMTRVQLMRVLLDWFGAGSGVCETRPAVAPAAVAVVPNPFRSGCRVLAPAGTVLELFDAAGRRVLPALAPGELARHLARSPAGAYFIRDARSGQALARALKLR